MAWKLNRVISNKVSKQFRPSVGEVRTGGRRVLEESGRSLKTSVILSKDFTVSQYVRD